jgi:predicted nucleic acid-binding protein
VILVDTSAWVRFFKGSQEANFIATTVSENSAILHPLVLGELLLGGLSEENESLLRALPVMQLPTTTGVYSFIKDNSLSGKGIGWVDAVILCSAIRQKVVVATFDMTLQTCAKELGIARLLVP